MSEQKYYVKVTMEAGSYDADKPYQETSFTQNYSDRNQQIEEQQPLFNAIAVAVASNMTEAGDKFLANNK